MSSSSKFYEWKRGRSFTIKNLTSLMADYLREIENPPELMSDEAMERLFPSPGDPDNLSFHEDWHDFVVPDLENQLSKALKTVIEDVKKIKRTDDGYSVTIPILHLEAWVNALTQMRLAIAAAHSLTEEELSRSEFPQGYTMRDCAIHRMMFYGFLLEMLLNIGEAEGLWAFSESSPDDPPGDSEDPHDPSDPT